MTLTLILLFLASVSACTSGLRRPANIFDRDDREFIPKDGKLPIGTIHRNKERIGDWGTGFQIDACHIVTNYHVIDNSGKEHQKDYRVLYSDRAGSFVKARLVLSGRPDLLSDQRVSATNPLDWALLELEECQVKDFYFNLTSLKNFDLPLKGLQMLGFPDDVSPRSVALDPECEIKHSEAKKLYHVCASRPGSSGSPIFYEDDGEWHVVAINVSQRSNFSEVIRGYSNWIANVAIDPASYLAPIKAYLKEQELTAPLP